MTRKRTPSKSKKIVGLVLGVSALSCTVAVTTGLGFASEGDSGPDAARHPGKPTSGTFQASVRSGVQIYACTKQPDGTFAFTQHNVRATLKGGIKHSFVSPASGPPQWVAPDGSAVTGTVTSKTPHGAGNIPELELTATQTGLPTGKLASVTKIRRVNTQGGVAPTGPCDPAANPTVEVPYSAVYEFIASPSPSTPAAG
ncbi:DUF3455 domain-containing protein [Streptomyces cacaoi]|uniref:DUF3455 domain-containing protein n=1 Tax=Streptomyces cacaoi TaxID=1898 RepID=UPI003748A82E